MRKVSPKGLTLIELLIVVNIIAILAGTASIALSEYSDEASTMRQITMSLKTRVWIYLRLGTSPTQPFPMSLGPFQPELMRGRGGNYSQDFNSGRDNRIPPELAQCVPDIS